MDRIIQTKGPIVMFMGHIGVPQKKTVKGKACFIFYFCVLCSACRVEICYPLCLLLCYHQIIASYAFAEKPLKSDMLAVFTTSLALIEYPTYVF